MTCNPLLPMLYCYILLTSLYRMVAFRKIYLLSSYSSYLIFMLTFRLVFLWYGRRVFSVKQIKTVLNMTHFVLCQLINLMLQKVGKATSVELPNLALNKHIHHIFMISGYMFNQPIQNLII